MPDGKRVERSCRTSERCHTQSRGTQEGRVRLGRIGREPGDRIRSHPPSALPAPELPQVHRKPLFLWNSLSGALLREFQPPDLHQESILSPNSGGLLDGVWVPSPWTTAWKLSQATCRSIHSADFIRSPSLGVCCPILPLSQCLKTMSYILSGWFFVCLFAFFFFFLFF